jgi:hypothetical protein
MTLKIRFDEDLVSANARELDKIAKRFAKSERRRLYLATMIKRIVKELDFCEAYSLKLQVPIIGPNTAIFDDDPQTVHLAIGGDHCGWTFAACGGDVDEEFVDGVHVEYSHKSERTVNCAACLALLRRAEAVRAKRRAKESKPDEPSKPAIAAEPLSSTAALVVTDASGLREELKANPFYSGKVAS